MDRLSSFRFAEPLMQYGCLVTFLVSSLAVARFAQAQSTNPVPAPLSQQATITASSFCGGSKTYDQLTDPWRSLTPQTIQLGASLVELTIQSTQFDDRPVTAQGAASPFFCDSNSLFVGVNVSTAGETYSFADGEGSFRGGGGGKLPADNFARLESLMDNLPDDGRKVPPPDRTVLVIVQRRGATTVRLYDSANLPDSIIEMIRLTGARIRIVAPVLKPDKIWSAEEAASLGLSRPGCRYRLRCSNSMSPTGSTCISDDYVTKTLTVYEGSDCSSGGVPKGGKIVRVIPEFWQGSGLRAAYAEDREFSPDGRYLLVSWGERIGAMLFDTRTWKPVTDPHLFPQNLKEYLHSPDWDLGIAVNEAGETLVWDERSHRILSKLPGLGQFELPIDVVTDAQGYRLFTIPSAEIRSVAFSSDGSRVAIYGGPDDALSLWNTESGHKLRDFWPVEWMSNPNGQPLWWNNGHWLLAPYSSQYSVPGEGVWDAETGRFKGSLDLSGCDARDAPVVSGDRLFQRCFASGDGDGKVLEWTVEGVVKQW